MVIVICHPFALLPSPKCAAKGRTVAETIKPPKYAPKNLKDDALVRSTVSLLMTPSNAVYGMLTAEYININMMKVIYAYASFPTSPKFGVVNARTAETDNGMAPHNK